MNHGRESKDGGFSSKDNGIHSNVASVQTNGFRANFASLFNPSQKDYRKSHFNFLNFSSIHSSRLSSANGEVPNLFDEDLSCTEQIKESKNDKMIPGTYGSQFGIKTTKPSRGAEYGPCSLSAYSEKRQKYLDRRRNIDTQHTKSVFHPRKRLSNSDDEEDPSFSQPRRKVFVNEEKMAARLDRLSLNATSEKFDFSNLPWYPDKNGISSNPRKVLEAIEKRLSDSDEEDLTEENESPIHVSEHLRALLKQQNKVLPEKIARIISNPCTDLVLWQPPSSPLEKICHKLKESPSRTLPGPSTSMEDTSPQVIIERPMSLLQDLEDGMDV